MTGFQSAKLRERVSPAVGLGGPIIPWPLAWRLHLLDQPLTARFCWPVPQFSYAPSKTHLATSPSPLRNGQCRVFLGHHESPASVLLFHLVGKVAMSINALSKEDDGIAFLLQF